jgi:hypothetical protein
VRSLWHQLRQAWPLLASGGLSASDCRSTLAGLLTWPCLVRVFLEQRWLVCGDGWLIGVKAAFSVVEGAILYAAAKVTA